MNENLPVYGMWLKSHVPLNSWIWPLLAIAEEIYSNTDGNGTDDWEISHSVAGPLDASKRYVRTYVVPYTDYNMDSVLARWKPNDALNIGPIEVRCGIDNFRLPHTWPEITLLWPQYNEINRDVVIRHCGRLIEQCVVWNMNVLYADNYWDFVRCIWPLEHERLSRRTGRFVGEIDVRHNVLGISYIFAIAKKMVDKCDPLEWINTMKQWESRRIHCGDSMKSDVFLFVCKEDQDQPSESAVLEILPHIRNIMPVY